MSTKKKTTKPATRKRNIGTHIEIPGAAIDPSKPSPQAPSTPVAPNPDTERPKVDVNLPGLPTRMSAVAVGEDGQRLSPEAERAALIQLKRKLFQQRDAYQSDQVIGKAMAFSEQMTKHTRDDEQVQNAINELIQACALLAVQSASNVRHESMYNVHVILEDWEKKLLAAQEAEAKKHAEVHQTESGQ